MPKRAACEDEQQQLKLRLLREEVRKGLENVERGEIVSAVDAFADFDKERADVDAAFE